jgi:hypothetical protein
MCTFMAGRKTLSPLAALPLPEHGARRLPRVAVESYNTELKERGELLGDRASHGAFRALLDKWRKPWRKAAADPFGECASAEISKKKLDAVLVKGRIEGAGIVEGAIEDFAQALALVVRRMRQLKTWRKTQRIVVGGGFRDSRVGELAIGRTAAILKAGGIRVELVPIRHNPDEAGLIGAVHLAPRQMFRRHDAILAVDIGGSSIRAGTVVLNLGKAADLSKAAVGRLECWDHAEEKRVGREDAVRKLVRMLEKLIAQARKEKLRLAPFVGIGCPGLIVADGTIDRGADNLPGRWDRNGFNVPLRLCREIPRIGKRETRIVLHNDAVLQGLSEQPFMTDVRHWGVLTIGTGLGNAQFTNRKSKDEA